MDTVRLKKPVKLTFGLSSLLIATFALFISVAHLTIGPFEKQKPIEQTIGETAVKIKEAAKRAITGKPAPIDKDDGSAIKLDILVKFSALALAALAMLAGIAGMATREKRPFAYMGFALGTGVLLMAWLQWIAILICGVILLVSIINNIGDILPS